MVFVQFTDESETEIRSVFACHQDDSVYKNQAEVEPDDPRYLSFCNPPPPPAPTLESLRAQIAAIAEQISLLS